MCTFVFNFKHFSLVLFWTKYVPKIEYSIVACKSYLNACVIVDQTGLFLFLFDELRWNFVTNWRQNGSSVWNCLVTWPLPGCSQSTDWGSLHFILLLSLSCFFFHNSLTPNTLMYTLLHIKAGSYQNWTATVLILFISCVMWTQGIFWQLFLLCILQWPTLLWLDRYTHTRELHCNQSCAGGC